MQKVLIFLLMLIVVLHFNCNTSDSNSVKGRLINIIDSTKKYPVIIEFKDITNFNWDTLHIFTPYTSSKKIEAQLGFNWDEISKQTIGMNDGINLFVFTKGKSVVSYFEFSRGKVDFPGDSKTIFSKSEALFELKEESSGSQKFHYFYHLKKR